MAYHYLWLEAPYVFGALDPELAVERAGALAGGADHPRNSYSKLWHRAGGHRGARVGGHHHRTSAAFHRVSDYVSHARPLPVGAESRSEEHTSELQSRQY